MNKVYLVIEFAIDYDDNTMLYAIADSMEKAEKLKVEANNSKWGEQRFEIIEKSVNVVDMECL